MKNKGFTLIELMVVISIIAIISAISVTSYQNIRQKTRDSVRKGDLQKISLALEGYFQKNGRYVLGSGNCDTDTTTFYNDPDITSKFIGGVPIDPLSGSNYCFESIDNGTGFRLFSKIEDITQINITNCQNQSYNYTITSENLTPACP